LFLVLVCADFQLAGMTLNNFAGYFYQAMGKFMSWHQAGNVKAKFM
jgi:hypothetical protein